MEMGIVREIERRIITDFMDVIILSMLYNSRNAIGGCDVIKYLHKRFHFLVSPGTVYSHIYALERKGLIQAMETQRKRVYSLTEKGQRFAEKLANSKERIASFIVNLISKNGVKSSQ
jgi:DNA-binding PadR family transcriptional regulator